MDFVEITELDDGSAKVVINLTLDEIILFARSGIRTALLDSLDYLEEYEESVDDTPIGEPQPDISSEILDKHFGVL